MRPLLLSVAFLAASAIAMPDGYGGYGGAYDDDEPVPATTKIKTTKSSNPGGKGGSTKSTTTTTKSANPGGKGNSTKSTKLAAETTPACKAKTITVTETETDRETVWRTPKVKTKVVTKTDIVPAKPVVRTTTKKVTVTETATVTVNSPVGKPAKTKEPYKPYKPSKPSKPDNGYGGGYGGDEDEEEPPADEKKPVDDEEKPEQDDDEEKPAKDEADEPEEKEDEPPVKPAPSKTKANSTKAAPTPSKDAAKTPTPKKPAPVEEEEENPPAADEEEEEPPKKPTAPAKPSTPVGKAAPSATPNKSKDTRDDKTKCLEEHNKYRKKHGATPLKWNQEMADFAEEHSSDCKMRHSTADWGENLSEGYDDVVDAIRVWYEEINIYDPDNTKLQLPAAHFTQMIWKATKEMGCYNRKCPKGDYLVCEYNPAGNIQGDNGKYFKENLQL